MSEPAAQFPVLDPDVQVSFYHRFLQLQQLYLYDALKRAVGSSDLQAVNAELSQFVSLELLSRVASFGLRGEVFFPVPLLIQAEPRLVGYYRLLLGFSQKEFYTKGPFGRLKTLEEKGQIPPAIEPLLAPFCQSLAGSAELLITGIDDLSLAVIRDLQLLTLGPQLRGSRNTRLGQDATQDVFDLIRSIVGPFASEITDRVIRVENSAGRTVLIEFFSDPDVRIVEQLSSTVRPIVSIEIKGGADRSNIHNWLGEAEKSHQKAKTRGFFEFWTILRARVDVSLARRESPTTRHFFSLDSIRTPSTPDNVQFRELLGALVGIPLS